MKFTKEGQENFKRLFQEQNEREYKRWNEPLVDPEAAQPIVWGPGIMFQIHRKDMDEFQLLEKYMEYYIDIYADYAQKLVRLRNHLKKYGDNAKGSYFVSKTPMTFEEFKLCY